MFAAPELRGATIPYYNADVEQAVLLRDRLGADTSFVLPRSSSATSAMRYEGRAMGAALPAGAIVLLRRGARSDYSRGGICDYQAEKL